MCKTLTDIDVEQRQPCTVSVAQ